METKNVQQGSEEWLKLRLQSNTASEAPVMLGDSSYQARNELLELKKTGMVKEFSEWVEKNILTKGHDIEAKARVMAEKFIGEELYPVTGTKFVGDLQLLASFDGLTMLEDIVWECKTANKSNTIVVQDGKVPDCYKPQLEQQMMVSGAEKALFTVSDGTEEGTHHVWYHADKELQNKILIGWRQFHEDLENYEIPTPEVVIQPKTIADLPSLNIQVKGSVTLSNLSEYKEIAMDFIESINTELNTDEDFFHAEKTAKWLGESEKKLVSTSEQILGQTSSIDEALKTIDYIREEMRQKRLTLSKLVKLRKEQIKKELMLEAINSLKAFALKTEQELKVVRLPELTYDFNSVIKGKSNIASIKDSIDTELANLKINITETAQAIKVNLELLDQVAPNHKFLFNDLQQIITKPKDDFEAIVNLRVITYEDKKKADEEERIEAEKKRLEAEKVREIEAEKARLEAEKVREIEAEKAKLIAEQQQQEEPIQEPEPVIKHEKHAVIESKFIPKEISLELRDLGDVEALSCFFDEENIGNILHDQNGSQYILEITVKRKSININSKAA